MERYPQSENHLKMKDPLRQCSGSALSDQTAERSLAGPLVLTVDVEDYFQVSGFEDIVPRSQWERFESRVERNTDQLLKILADAKATATFFVLGWIAERHPALVRSIHGTGHEIACHSYDHRLIYQCAPDAFREDARRAKRILENLIGERVIGYRAPSFSITRKSLWALDILAEEGFEYDSSIFPILRDRYGMPGAPRFPFQVPVNGRSEMLEIPPSTLRLLGLTLPLGGGGYLRLFPEGLFRWALEHIRNVERKVIVLYIHPWELDPDQPKIANAPGLSTFRQYVNLDKTEGRLRRLLATFPPVAIRTILTRLNAEARFWAPTDPSSSRRAPEHTNQGAALR